MASNTALLNDDMFRQSGAVVVDPGSASGFPGTRLRDDKDYLRWKSDGAGNKDYDVTLSGALTPDSIGIANHNLGSEGAEIEVYEGASAPGALVTTITPTEDHDIFRTGIAFSSNVFYRVRVKDATADTQIGQIMLGRRIAFPFANDWPQFDPTTERRSSRQSRIQKGHIVRTVNEFTERLVALNFGLLPFSFLDDATVPTGFRYWWENFGLKGFPSFVSWNAGNPGSFERDCLWGTVRGDRSQPLRTALDTGFRDLRLTFAGRKT